MLLTGQIIDNQTLIGIPFASIQITNDDATANLGGTVADENGLYLLDSPQLDGSPLYISSTGYLPVLVHDDVYTTTGIIGLDQFGELPAVVVTPHKHDEWLIWLLVGGGLLLLIATAKKEHKVKGVTIPKLADNQWVDIALKIGIPVAIFFLVIKPILVKLNILNDKAEQQQSESDQQAENQQQQLGSYNSADNHSYTSAQLDQAAVQLRDATAHWYGYDWASLAAGLTWIPGMTGADARYFIGTFVKKNGQTLYRWYLDKFRNATIFKYFTDNDILWETGWGGTGGKQPYDYRSYYAKMGITLENASDFSWSEVVNKFISYAYQIAGITQQ